MPLFTLICLLTSFSPLALAQAEGEQKQVRQNAGETNPELKSAPQAIPALKIPPRPIKAMTGRQFLKATRTLSLANRELRIQKELEKGNVPTFLRRYVPIPVMMQNEMRVLRSGWIFVMPDYLAIGSDEDYVRIPMTPVTAQRIASLFDGQLPTSAMVNAVYDGADMKLPPHFLPPGLVMRSNDYFLKYENILASQVKGVANSALIAGHKKDVVISNHLRPGRVAIYGWHAGPGEPVQPLTVWHWESYTDYSHGVRLVHKTMLIVDEKWSTKDVLRHSYFSGLVSFEGPLKETEASVKSINWSKDEARTPYNFSKSKSKKGKKKTGS